MQGYFAIATLLLLMGMLMLRVFLMSKMGIKVMKFAEIDKKDFLILPFSLFFLYLIFANALNLPKVGTILFRNETISWIGVAFCMLGLVFVFLSIVSFGKSFRIGLDEDQPGKLTTTGLFACSRNPIYTSFGLILIGLCLIFIDWILLLYLVAALWLFNRQVLLEEASLKNIYGDEYLQYCKKVRRYL